jgi:hypothetical protein
VYSCKPEELQSRILSFQELGLNPLNIGIELSHFISELNDFKFITIDVLDHLKLIYENNIKTMNGALNPAIVVYNLGILMEPFLELNTIQLLKDWSKTCTVIILWENQTDIPFRLYWSTQSKNFNLDFSDTPYKMLQYAI